MNQQGMGRIPSVALGAVLLLSCAAHNGAQPVQPSPPVEVHTTAATKEASVARLTVADEIQKTCALPVEDDRAPHFDFDSATLRPRGEAILDAVAECLTHGPLAGREVRITGYTDERGRADYNEALGLYRATAAKLRLELRGVAGERVEARSLGEREASGSAADSRARDRRVEIELR